MTSQPALQPAVHHLLSCVHAPAATLSDRSGRIEPSGAAGCYLGERRLLCVFELLAFGRAIEVVQSRLEVDGVLTVTAIVRDGTEDTPDPVLLVRQTRRAHPSGFTDTITIDNAGTRLRSVPVSLVVASDVAPTSVVKTGRGPLPPVAAVARRAGLCFERDGYALEVSVTPDAHVDAEQGIMSWNVVLDPGARWTSVIDVRGEQPADGAFRPSAVTAPAWEEPAVVTDLRSLQRLVDWSFGDLRRLALADPLAPADTFIAAGSPWYFTLFGRDSLWTARMVMPFGQALAAGTLRSLARRQGVTHDSAAAEQPGRIPHEVRPAAVTEGTTTLPPVYYGSIDATPLWITTLAEAWRWGLDEAEVVALLPALEAAVDWLVEIGDPDGDGLCEYIDVGGTGLSNQGWKDSGDSINWHDGALAIAPIALVEVQGYVYEAANNAIQLYDHFHIAPTDRLRRFADRLRVAFHERFWVVDDSGPHLAVALDADKRAVDSITSNPGHVLGTGLLDADQESMVVNRLLTELDCGVGLRTMSGREARFNPLSYHNGSIWPHDTAICARGMVLAGRPDAAARLISGLLDAADVFDGRLPELFGSIDARSPVVPYLASCRPQAWTAAVGPAILWALAPLLPGVPGQAPRLLAGVDLSGCVDIDGFSFAGHRVAATSQASAVTFDWPPPHARWSASGVQLW